MADAWTEKAPAHDSPYYPFWKVAESDTLAGMEQIPYVLVKYLMDLPDGTGYIPPSDNKYPRARLKKLPRQTNQVVSYAHSTTSTTRTLLTPQKRQRSTVKLSRRKRQRMRQKRKKLQKTPSSLAARE